MCGGDGAEGACDCDGNVLDECGVCGGDGIADGACDCDGNVLDECGVCGGEGIAEGACDCDGNVLDECGVCGGDGIAEGACDCDGNVLDECGECAGWMPTWMVSATTSMSAWVCTMPVALEAIVPCTIVGVTASLAAWTATGTPMNATWTAMDSGCHADVSLSLITDDIDEYCGFYDA